MWGGWQARGRDNCVSFLYPVPPSEPGTFTLSPWRTGAGRWTEHSAGQHRDRELRDPCSGRETANTDSPPEGPQRFPQARALCKSSPGRCARGAVAVPLWGPVRTSPCAHSAFSPFPLSPPPPCELAPGFAALEHPARSARGTAGRLGEAERGGTWGGSHHGSLRDSDETTRRRRNITALSRTRAFACDFKAPRAHP